MYCQIEEYQPVTNIASPEVVNALAHAKDLLVEDLNICAHSNKDRVSTLGIAIDKIEELFRKLTVVALIHDSPKNKPKKPHHWDEADRPKPCPTNGCWNQHVVYVECVSVITGKRIGWQCFCPQCAEESTVQPTKKKAEAAWNAKPRGFPRIDEHADDLMGEGRPCPDFEACPECGSNDLKLVYPKPGSSDTLRIECKCGFSHSGTNEEWRDTGEEWEDLCRAAAYKKSRPQATDDSHKDTHDHNLA